MSLSVRCGWWGARVEETGNWGCFGEGGCEGGGGEGREDERERGGEGCGVVVKLTLLLYFS